MSRIFRLSDSDFSFPPAEWANDEFDGLLAVGGGYEPERLLNAYTHGIFPWPINEIDEVTWFSPDPRMVLMAQDLHVPKSLARILKSKRYTITIDQAFPEVIHACSTVIRPHEEGTWITSDLEKGYCQLHQLGFAHSVEAWLDGELAGGLYGVAIGKCFFGESMFARKPDASKCAFVTAARQLFENGTPWIDCQVYTDHLARFGAKEISRSDYLALLRTALDTTPTEKQEN